jgi:hypothetical protein
MNHGHQTTAQTLAQALAPVTGTVTPLPATALTDKEFSTLQAQFALHGQTLSRLPGSVALYCSRWGMVKHLPTVEDAHRFLEQVGGDL